MKKILNVLLVILLVMSSLFVSAQSKKDDYKVMRKEIFQLINEHRHRQKLADLIYNDTLQAIAAKHSENMASGRIPFSHQGSEGRMKEVKLKLGKLYSYAENVAGGDLDAAGVVAEWLKSAEHRKNIEGEYEMTGIGIAKSEDGELFFTQILMR